MNTPDRSIENLAPSAAHLSAQIQAKLRMLEALLDKGKQQLQLIQSGDTTKLLELLAEKSTLIRELAAIQETISRLQQPDVQSMISWPDPAQRAAAQAAAKQCNLLGQQVLELEATCEHAARERRDSMAQQIEEFSVFESRKSESLDPNDGNPLASFDESS